MLVLLLVGCAVLTGDSESISSAETVSSGASVEAPADGSSAPGAEEPAAPAEPGCVEASPELALESPDGPDLYTSDRDCGTGECTEVLWHPCSVEGLFRRVAEVETNNFPVRLGARRHNGHPDLLVDMDLKHGAGPNTGEQAGFALGAWLWDGDAYVAAPPSASVADHPDYAIRKLPVSGGACDLYWLEHRDAEGRWTILHEGVVLESRMAWSAAGVPAGFDSCPENLEGVFAGAHSVKVSDPEYANAIRWEGDTVVVTDGSASVSFAYGREGLTAVEP